MWLLTGDDQGFIKYWQSNMNNVQMYQAHKDQAVRCARYYHTSSYVLRPAISGGIPGKLFSSKLKREKYNVICSLLRSILCHLCRKYSCATCTCNFISVLAMLCEAVVIYMIHCISLGFNVFQLLLHYLSINHVADFQKSRKLSYNITFTLNIIIFSSADKS